MAFLFLLWMNLLPTLLRQFYNGLQVVELLYCALYSLIFALPLFFTGKKSKTYLWSLYLPLSVFGLVDLFYAQVFKSSLVLPVMSTIFESNPGESSEFISMYLSLNLFLLALLYMLVAVPLVYFSKPLPPMEKARKLLRFSLLLLAMLILPLKSKDWTIAFHYHSALKPLVMFGQYLSDSKRYQQGRENWKLNGKFSAIELVDPKAEEMTLVLVIGESLTRRHMSVYGYPRPTTPVLAHSQAVGELIAFTQVSAPSFVTVEALKTISTFATVEKMDDYYDKGNVVDYFRQAGFETFWFSNQQMIEGRLTSVSANAFAAHQYRFLNESGTKLGVQSFDEVLLPSLDQALKHPAKRKLIVLHQLGSHMSYKNRYPENFANAFQEDVSFPPYAIAQWQKQMVNEYDRSVLYSDWFLGQVMERLREINHSASLVFLSDHGEEVFDSMDFVGHVDTSKVVFEIPLIIWPNKHYRENFKNSFKRFQAAEHRSWRSDGLPHLLIELARLSSDEFDPRQSLISPVY